MSLEIRSKFYFWIIPILDIEQLDKSGIFYFHANLLWQFQLKFISYKSLFCKNVPPSECSLDFQIVNEEVCVEARVAFIL